MYQLCQDEAVRNCKRQPSQAAAVCQKNESGLLPMRSTRHSRLISPALGRLQVIGEPARFIVSVALEPTSLVNMSSKGNLHSADDQIDSLVHNIETVSLPCHFIPDFSFPKYVNHKNLIIIGSGENGGTLCSVFMVLEIGFGADAVALAQKHKIKTWAN